MITNEYEPLDYPYIAHHIVGCDDARAEDARKILQRCGVDIDGVANGVYLPTTKAVPGADTVPAPQRDLMTKDPAIDPDSNRPSFFAYVGELSDSIRAEVAEKAAEAAVAFDIDTAAGPANTVDQINDVVDDLLKSTDPDDPVLIKAAVALGALYGDAICEAYGWEWMAFGESEEKAHFGVVSPKWNFCMIPLSYILRILQDKNIGLGGENDNTVALLFNMLDGQDDRPDSQKMVPLR